MKFNRLLVPLDGSEAAQVALVYAAAIPSERIRLLTVLSSEDAGSGFAPADQRSALQDQWRTAIEHHLETAAEAFREQGRVVEIEVVYGGPAEWIETYSQDSDMVIMTTHGRGAGRRLVYGSVADRIARSSQIPVMLIRGGNEPITAQPIVRLVVPLDGSELSEQAVPFAASLATRLGTPVLFARVIDPVQFSAAAQLAASPVTKYAGSLDAVRAAIADYLETRAEILREHDIPVETVVAEGEPAPAINDLALPGDVIVMTSQGRGGITRWMLGSVTESLVRNGNTPVIIVRAKASEES